MAAKRQYDLDLFKRLFITGEMSLRAISKKYGVSYGYISSQSSRNQWAKDKASMDVKVQNAEQETELKKLKESLDNIQNNEVSTTDEHVRRSMQTGDKLGELLQCGIVAVKQNDWRNLKTAVETWVGWDNQMRKNHGVEANEEPPSVNINVMASLPSLKEVQARTVEHLEKRKKEAARRDTDDIVLES